MARKKKGLKYRARAERIRKTIRKWTKRGNPNVTYYVTFLDTLRAHFKAQEGRRPLSESNCVYCKNRTSTSLRLVQRDADFLLTKRKDVNEAKYRLGEAIRFYEEWGATGKVQQLKDRVDGIRIS